MNGYMSTSQDLAMKKGSWREQTHSSDTCEGVAGHRCKCQWTLTLMMLGDKTLMSPVQKLINIFNDHHLDDGSPRYT